MLAKVAGNRQNKFIKPVKVRNLPAVRSQITVDNTNQPEVLQDSDSPPEGGFTTPWLLCNLGFFRINLTIVSPEAKEPEGYFPLSRRQAQDQLEQVSDIIKLL